MTNKTKKRGQFKRRTFLKGAAVGAAAVAAPFVWIPKKSFAATPAFGKAKHVLIFFSGGGMRTSAVFNGDVAVQYNPYGIHSGTGTEWGVSGLFSGESTMLTTWNGEELPAFPDMAKNVAVLGTVDHAPNYMGGGTTSHNSGPLYMSTGYANGLNGVLSFVGEYAYHTQEKYIPPFIVGNQARLFGLGAGKYSQFRPVMLGGANDFSLLTGGLDVEGGGLGWNSLSEQGLDTSFLDSRHYHMRQNINTFLQAKKDAVEFIDTFMDPALQITTDPDAELQGVTNAQLLEVFNDGHWGERTALAVRLLQIGSPAVAIGQGGYDNHSNEEMAMRPRIESLGRTWSGLHFVLNRIPHPDGGTYWDHTMVVACTEFARDNTYSDTGFNNGGGTDHVGSKASRYQAVGVMGGPVAVGGKLLGRTDPKSFEAVDKVYHSQGVLSTILDVMGIKSEDYFEAEPFSDLFE